jgi:hypothetical protein
MVHHYSTSSGAGGVLNGGEDVVWCGRQPQRRCDCEWTALCGFVGERVRSGSGLGRGPERPRCGGVDKAWRERQENGSRRRRQ